MDNQNKSLIDSFLDEIQCALSTIYDNSVPEAVNKDNSKLNKEQTDVSTRIIRINHMGEVCAQALYRGQAAFTRKEKMKDQLYKICDEENEHLKLCNLRLS